MPGTPATNVVYKSGNIGVTVTRASARFTGTFPSGSSVVTVPVGRLNADDLVMVEQRNATTDTLQIHESQSLRVTGDAGVVTLMTDDGNNADTNINFALHIHRNG